MQITLRIASWTILRPHIQELGSSAACHKANTGSPGDCEYTGYDFFPFFASANAQLQAERFACINIFLNWFKLNMYLEFIPQFSLLFRTFRNASGPIGSFAVIFLISFVGFSFSHTILFHHSIYHFRDIRNGQLGLLRLLLGDLDADQIIEMDPIMGPVLYMCFTTFCVLIIFNILISILMDAYERAMIECQKLPKLNIWESFGHWFSIRFVCVFHWCCCCCFGAPKNAHLQLAAETIQAFWRYNRWHKNLRGGLLSGQHQGQNRDTDAAYTRGERDHIDGERSPGKTGDLQALCQMKRRGYLTETEFSRVKAELINEKGEKAGGNRAYSRHSRVAAIHAAHHLRVRRAGGGRK